MIHPVSIQILTKYTKKHHGNQANQLPLVCAGVILRIFMEFGREIFHTAPVYA
jgi:hypothetical protein